MTQYLKCPSTIVQQGNCDTLHPMTNLCARRCRREVHPEKPIWRASHAISSTTHYTHVHQMRMETYDHPVKRRGNAPSKLPEMRQWDVDASQG